MAYRPSPTHRPARRLRLSFALLVFLFPAACAPLELYVRDCGNRKTSLIMSSIRCKTVRQGISHKRRLSHAVSLLSQICPANVPRPSCAPARPESQLSYIYLVRNCSRRQTKTPSGLHQRAFLQPAESNAKPQPRASACDPRSRRRQCTGSTTQAKLLPSGSQSDLPARQAPPESPLHPPRQS